jgi:hypothetical protein
MEISMTETNPNDLQPDGGDELLDTGQEEVFSRSEVERGVTEHASASGAHPGAADAPIDPEEAAEHPPTREGGADTGRTADDVGRGGD